jgi:hypothetical protein
LDDRYSGTGKRGGKKMIIKKLFCVALLVIIIAESSYALPSVIGINKLEISSSEVLVIKPYKADVSQLKDELDLYRKLYLIFALLQGYVLIKAVAR